MMNTCQQRLLAFHKSQESLVQSSKELSRLVTSIPCQDEGIYEQLEEESLSLIEKIDNQIEAVEQASVVQNQQLKDLRNEVNSLSEKKAAQEKIMRLVEEEQAQLAKEQVYIQTPGIDIIESKIQNLRTEDDMFKQQLGMEINKIKGGFLQIVFSHINVNRPDSLYMFSIKLDENRKYIVSDFKPPIADTDELVAKLNSDNNFSNFIHTVRRKFKEEAVKET